MVDGGGELRAADSILTVDKLEFHTKTKVKVPTYVHSLQIPLLFMFLRIPDPCKVSFGGLSDFFITTLYILRLGMGWDMR
jgi:hypothetical protein